MNQSVIVNGALVNLLCSRGMSVEKALEMLFEVNRIQPSHNQPKSPDNKGFIANGAPLLSDKDAIFHRARHRICKIEKAIDASIAGREHGLKRGKWRKEKGDAEAIFAVLGHVLSRPNPETHEEMVEDARRFMIKTGELRCHPNHRPAPIANYAPIEIARSGSTAITLGTTILPGYEIRFQAPSTTTKINITLHEGLPVTMVEALQAKLREHLGPSDSIRNHLGHGSSEPEALEARHFIDWKALNGPMRAWLVGIYESRTWNDSEPKLQLSFEIENSRIE